uniref:Uncharacterized protein n=1 Tax=Rhizophora mucronata TaxID=61149 RepID=A0A2P2QZY4_RHIMU
MMLKRIYMGVRCVSREMYE